MNSTFPTRLTRVLGYALKLYSRAALRGSVQIRRFIWASFFNTLIAVVIVAITVVGVVVSTQVNLSKTVLVGAIYRGVERRSLALRNIWNLDLVIFRFTLFTLFSTENIAS